MLSHVSYSANLFSRWRTLQTSASRGCAIKVTEGFQGKCKGCSFTVWNQQAKQQQMDAVQATLSDKNVFISLLTGFGKSLVYQLLPVCAKELSSLISTDYHPFVVILSSVCEFVVKKIIIFIWQFALVAYTGMWQIELDPLSRFRKPHPLSIL